MNIKNINNKNEDKIMDSKRYPIEYSIEKDAYNNFLKKMEKSDFKHAPTRYIAELNIVKSLIKTAEKYKLEDELSELQIRKGGIDEALKEDFGITINN